MNQILVKQSLKSKPFLKGVVEKKGNRLIWTFKTNNFEIGKKIISGNENKVSKDDITILMDSKLQIEKDKVEFINGGIRSIEGDYVVYEIQIVSRVKSNRFSHFLEERKSEKISKAIGHLYLQESKEVSYLMDAADDLFKLKTRMHTMSKLNEEQNCR